MQCMPKYLGISRQAKHVTIHHMPSLGKMGKVSKLGGWVPHALSEKNKAGCLQIATSLLSRQRNNPFLDKIITGDEKWITYDNVARKKQWVVKDKFPQPDPKTELHGRKIMLCVWRNHRIIIRLIRPAATACPSKFARKAPRTH